MLTNMDRQRCTVPRGRYRPSYFESATELHRLPGAISYADRPACKRVIVLHAGLPSMAHYANQTSARGQGPLRRAASGRRRTRKRDGRVQSTACDEAELRVDAGARPPTFRSACSVETGAEGASEDAIHR